MGTARAVSFEARVMILQYIVTPPCPLVISRQLQSTVQGRVRCPFSLSDRFVFLTRQVGSRRGCLISLSKKLTVLKAYKVGFGVSHQLKIRGGVGPGVFSYV